MDNINVLTIKDNEILNTEQIRSVIQLTLNNEQPCQVKYYNNAYYVHLFNQKTRQFNQYYTFGFSHNGNIIKSSDENFLLAIKDFCEYLNWIISFIKSHDDDNKGDK